MNVFPSSAVGLAVKVRQLAEWHCARISSARTEEADMELPVHIIIDGGTGRIEEDSMSISRFDELFCA